MNVAARALLQERSQPLVDPIQLPTNEWRSTRLAEFSSVFLRVALGGAFLSAVADRFGLWGAYGYPNVAWGSYSRFVAYTAKLLWLLPPACPPRLMPATRPAPKARTLRSYYEEWIERKVPPLVRKNNHGDQYGSFSANHAKKTSFRRLGIRLSQPRRESR